ncbi:MAG: hypothetical protein D6731_01385 [Planctomycetota bacterium]|nr:MAG: hypothetical protein D6731_01385 [Planctomycetota bacterium]
MSSPHLVCLVLAAASSLFLSGCRDGRRADGLDVPGARARALLAANPYESLVVEVDAVVGHEPSPAALALLERRLAERCHKPGGVRVVLDELLPDPGRQVWSLADVRAFEAKHRQRRDRGSEATLYVAYLAGRSSWDVEAERVMGWAVSGSVIALFPEAVAANATPEVPSEAVESATLVHELGHLLGLVNMGIPMEAMHEDLRHLGHDQNPDCVMFHAVETHRPASLGDRLPPTDFDAACVRDLRAAGGR